MDNASGVRNFFEYLPASITFHKLKNEGLARIIFVLVLFCQLIGSYVQYKVLNLISTDDLGILYSTLTMGTASSSKETSQPTEHILYLLLIVLGTTLLVKLVSNLFFAVYMHSYISELRGKDTGYIASFKGVFKHIWRLICYNIIFGLLVLIGLMFFIVPGVIAYVIFVFGFCYILDLKLKISDVMTASSEITRGKKTQIVSVFAGFFLLFESPILLLLSGSSLGIAYAASFFSTIASLILQRLIVKIYMDLEYKKGITTK
ncbi:MAG TPA: hypothetical protein VIK78_13295 [Ruminiclostridium sp.]